MLFAGWLQLWPRCPLYSGMQVEEAAYPLPSDSQQRKKSKWQDHKLALKAPAWKLNSDAIGQRKSHDPIRCRVLTTGLPGNSLDSTS